MNFYKYDSTTGIIVATGMASPETVLIDDFMSNNALDEVSYQAAVDAAESDLLTRLGDNNTIAVKGNANALTQKVDISTGDLVAYTPPAEIIDYEGKNRALRNILLNNSDWTQMADSPLSETKKQEWATYRQALRDLPGNVSTFTTADLTAADLPNEPS